MTGRPRSRTATASSFARVVFPAPSTPSTPTRTIPAAGIALIAWASSHTRSCRRSEAGIWRRLAPLARTSGGAHATSTDWVWCGQRCRAGCPWPNLDQPAVPDHPRRMPEGMARVMNHLTDRVALVTGAGRGIGAATARRLAADGAAVAVADLTAGDTEVTATAISDSGGTAIGVGCDVTVADQVEAAVEM